MRRDLLRTVAAVGLSMLAANAYQAAMAQAVREPTVDARFRENDAKAPEEVLPLTKPGQSKSAQGNPATAVRPQQAYLGVSFSSDRREAIVWKVAPSSPADQAGLQPNDMIESLQGQPVRTYQDVLNIVAKLKPGDTLDVGYSRRMNVRTQAALAAMPAATTHSVGYPPYSQKSTSGAPEDPEMMLTPQDKGEAKSGQRRGGNQNNGLDENQRGRGRFFRRR